MGDERVAMQGEPEGGRPDSLLRMLMAHPGLTPADALPRMLDMAVASLLHHAA